MAKLRIYTDENVDIRVAQGLRNRGIDALTAQENGMTGSTDLEHFNYAYQMQAVIFTHDRHFLEIAKKLSDKANVKTITLCKTFLMVISDGMSFSIAPPNRYQE